MNSKTKQKINQVSEKTLVIGIDIAKRTHNACAVEDRGCMLKIVPLQTREGFDTFYERLLALRATHEKSDVLVGFKPTGHYWINLAVYLCAHGIPFSMVNPHHVSRSKELDDNLQTKNNQVIPAFWRSKKSILSYMPYYLELCLWA
ncbi:hypothetical protein C3943_14415 [Lysinibacillus sp. B2A1]|nr:hypothetical protein C3943_14415 [Lysinibacillus sp. B2A1]